MAFMIRTEGFIQFRGGNDSTIMLPQDRGSLSGKVMGYYVMVARMSRYHQRRKTDDYAWTRLQPHAIA